MLLQPTRAIARAASSPKVRPFRRTPPHRRAEKVGVERLGSNQCTKIHHRLLLFLSDVGAESERWSRLYHSVKRMTIAQLMINVKAHVSNFDVFWPSTIDNS